MSGNGTNSTVVQLCEACGEDHARLVTERVAFEYGDRSAALTLHADMPMWVCDACGERYTAEGAEAAEREAICRHLGRLTPTEIVNIRMKAKLTQDGFARRLGVGRVTLARWETGQQLQSAVYDKLVRDLAKNINTGTQVSRYRFQTDVSGRRSAAHEFELIRSVAA